VEKMRKISVLALIIIFALALGGCEEEAEVPIETVVLELDIMGNGTVKNLEEGQNAVEKGAILDLIAVPDAGWVFDQWEGVERKYERETGILMNEEKEIKAVFEEQYFDLEIDYLVWLRDEEERERFSITFDITNLTDEEREHQKTTKIMNQNNEIVYVDEWGSYPIDSQETRSTFTTVNVKEAGLEPGEYKAYIRNDNSPTPAINFTVE